MFIGRELSSPLVPMVHSQLEKDGSEPEA